MNTPYIGRFAPSPSGPLHFGSLIAALASYLDARAHDGQWLVRMEDIDPPREVPGAARAILKTLEAHQLEWDGEVLYQSHRSDAYNHYLDQLAQQDLSYRCNCTRQRLKELVGVYDQHCLQNPPKKDAPAAIRLRTDSKQHHGNFLDIFQGEQIDNTAEEGDFVIHRKDGLYAYQLAVTVDDAYQNITHVIRGSDLLSTTCRQRYLHQLLGFTPPQYGHFPVAVNADGNKLSKQNHAPAVDSTKASQNLAHAFQFLNHELPIELEKAPASEQLQWGVRHWQRKKIPATLAKNHQTQS
ncbi:MAG: tRNA glutamyl-Q(34) synthetase GluQRS [Cellvibrionaceae bacterium]